MLIDLGIEFLSFAYILIYVGAIAVMFLFVIVAVDPKYENQKELFEDTAVLAIFFNNVLLGLLYILIVRHSEKGVFINSEGLIIKNNSKFLQILDISLIEKKGEFLVLQKILDSNWKNCDLALNQILEYKLNDIHVFSDYFYNNHCIILLLVGFILTVAMAVAIIIAKNFTLK